MIPVLRDAYDSEPRVRVSLVFSGFPSLLVRFRVRRAGSRVADLLHCARGEEYTECILKERCNDPIGSARDRYAGMPTGMSAAMSEASGNARYDSNNIELNSPFRIDAHRGSLRTCPSARVLFGLRLIFARDPAPPSKNVKRSPRNSTGNYPLSRR